LTLFSATCDYAGRAQENPLEEGEQEELAIAPLEEKVESNLSVSL